MFENPRRGRQATTFTTNAPKILDLKSSSQQIFSRKLPLDAPAHLPVEIFYWQMRQLYAYVAIEYTLKIEIKKIEVKTRLPAPCYGQC